VRQGLEPGVPLRRLDVLKEPAQVGRRQRRIRVHVDHPPVLRFGLVRESAAFVTDAEVGLELDRDDDPFDRRRIGLVVVRVAGDGRQEALDIVRIYFMIKIKFVALW
jgi:hypothetical protein